LAGYLGGYVPWFVYLHRTVFTFYTVAFVPFVALALTYAIAQSVGSARAAAQRHRSGLWLATATVIAALLFGAYFWPVWTAKWVPHWFWQAHMFLPSWI